MIRIIPRTNYLMIIILEEHVENLFNKLENCDAPKPGGPLTTRQPAEYKWRSGYPTPL